MQSPTPRKCLGASAICATTSKSCELRWGPDSGAVHNRIDETHRTLSDRIDETSRSLNDRIDETHRSLNDRIDETHRSLGDRIDETHRSLNDRIDETHRSLGDRIDETNKRLDIHFRWIMGTLVTLTGVLIAVIKL